MTEEHLALRRGETRDELQEDVDGAVAQILEVVRLPVVAGTWGEERIERVLPSVEGVRPDDVRDGLAQGAKRRRGFLRGGEVAEPGARLDPGGPGDRIDPHRPHQGRIDHEAAVAHRAPREVVPSASDREDQVMLPGEPYRAHHVRSTRRAHHRRGPPVDHRVPSGSCLVVTRLAGQAQAASERAAKRIQRLRRDRRRSFARTRDHACHGVRPLR
jgi:hypothetical protein